MTSCITTTATGRSPKSRWGYLDLFVSVLFDSTHRNLLYRNNGDGTFSRITGDPVANESGDCTGAEWADYDNDGYPDLFVSKYSGQNNALFRNNRNGTFTRISSGSIVNDGGSSIGCSWADYDNDGNFDLFVANGGRCCSELNSLYHNNGDGTFTKITGDIIVSQSGRWAGCAWGDYDNDGWLDLFVADEFTNNALYHNNGDGTFTRIISGSPVSDGGLFFGCAWGVYNNDGFLDLFVANGRSDSEQNNFFYHNDGNGNAWVKLKLVGTRSNRSGIGAKVRVSASIGGQTVRQLRQIGGGNGFGSQGTLLAHFGLGTATNIDTIRIEWPSGIAQELRNVAVNELLTITEPPGLQALGRSTNGSFQVALTSWAGLMHSFETSSNLTEGTPWQTVTATNRTTLVEDPASHEPQRFYRARPAN